MNNLGFRFFKVNRLIFSNIFDHGIHHNTNLVLSNARNKWSFQPKYDKLPAKDVDKMRVKYKNFYHVELQRLRLNDRGYYFLFLALFFIYLEFHDELMSYFQSIFGDPDREYIKEELEKEMKDEPQKLKLFMKAKSASIQLEKIDEEECPKKQRIGFRASRIIAYEDRLRAYSTPDKIFRYFATIQDTNGEIYMTPKDFVRSITPGVQQPETLGLDSFLRVDLRKDKIKNEVETDSVFYWFGENALINFSDYVFLLSVICTPAKQIEIAFRMFDLNGDGELDINEFDVVRSIIRSGSAMGKRHRDNTVTGNTLSVDMNSSLGVFFFGKDGSKKLNIHQFLEFQSSLQREIMLLEFNRYEPVNNKISEVDFADALLMYAGFSEHKKRKFIRRVKQRYPVEQTSQGVTFDDYMKFSHFLRCISDVDTALTFYHLAGASIDPQMFKHVSMAVANVHLSEHLVDVVFTLFDENNDNHLSNREFISVMKQRLLRGLDKPMDTGFIRLISSMATCSRRLIWSD